MAATPRHSLPFLSVGQAQKECTVNETLQLLDVLVAASVLEPPRSSPPSAPAVGDCYLIGPEPTGEWAGRTNCLGAWTSGGWRIIAPVPGMQAYDCSTGTWHVFRDDAWERGMLRGESLIVAGQQVVGRRQGPIAAPSGGTVVDVQARSAIEAIVVTLRQHGLIET